MDQTTPGHTDGVSSPLAMGDHVLPDAKDEWEIRGTTLFESTRAK